MTKSERGIALIDCVGFGLVTYAGYLASTSGDLTLALALFTFGMLPCIAHVVVFELKLRQIKAMGVGLLLAFALPGLTMLARFSLSWLSPQDALLIQPVLHWTAIVLTALVGTSTLFIAVSVLVQEIMDQMKGNRRPNVT